MARPVRRAAALTAAAALLLTGCQATDTPAAGVSDVVLTVGADDTRLSVTWFTTSDANACVQLASGRAPTTIRGTVTAAASDPTQRRVRADLAGLRPATAYTYRVGDCGSAWTPPVAFTTDADDTATFAFLGDPHVVEPGPWRTTVQRVVQDASPDVLLWAGDILDSADPAEQVPQWDAVLSAPELRSVPLGPTLGNHEGTAAGYGDHLSTPTTTVPADVIARTVTAPGSGDYWFTHGNTLVVSLNSNSRDIAAHGAVLAAAAAAHPEARWRVVVFHHAPFSAAGHALEEATAQLRSELAPVLSRNRVDLVLNGHDHHYARSLLIDGNTPVAGSVGPVLHPTPGQTLYVTAPSATAFKSYPLGDLPGWVAFAEAGVEASYVVVTAGTDELSVSYRRVADGQVLDGVALRRVG